jgi:hypothetical protein
MAKRVVPTALQINDRVRQYAMVDKSIGFIIRNGIKSAQNLYIGINEPASSKIILAPGESFTLSIDRDDMLYTDINLYFKFEEPDPDNSGFAIVNYLTDEEAC